MYLKILITDKVFEHMFVPKNVFKFLVKHGLVINFGFLSLWSHFCIGKKDFPVIYLFTTYLKYSILLMYTQRDLFDTKSGDQNHKLNRKAPLVQICSPTSGSQQRQIKK